MTVPTIPSPVQPGIGGKPVAHRLAIAVVVLAALLCGAIGYIVVTDVLPRVQQAADSAQDPYRNWPAAGTTPPFAGEKPFTAQGIIALTCRNGKAHIDENMLVGSSLREGVAPSWYVNLYVDYDQSKYQGFCEIRFAPLHQGTSVYKLDLMEDGRWAAQSDSLSFDGLNSISANHDDGDIAVLLVNFGDERVEPGIEIKYGDNGILAPSRELLRS